jgi:hypothetical protein
VKRAAALALVAMSVFAAPTSLRAETIDFSRQKAGEPPRDFEFWRADRVDIGHWAVAADPGATGGDSVEEVTPDKSDQPSMAVYHAVSATNVSVRTQFKLSGGKLPSAGIAVRVVSPRDYFLVRASAFEGRVSLIRVRNGAAEEVAGVDAEIEQDHWQKLEVAVKDDEFTITLDGRWVLTAFDRHARESGWIGLWTEQSASTLFDQIDISPAVTVQN